MAIAFSISLKFSKTALLSSFFFVACVYPVSSKQEVKTDALLAEKNGHA